LIGGAIVSVSAGNIGFDAEKAVEISRCGNFKAIESAAVADLDSLV
jgi:hypothetical protein